MTDTLFPEELKNLTSEEKEYFYKIIREFSIKGKSQSLDELNYVGYEEIPVDIKTFLHNPNYLGMGLIDRCGRYLLSEKEEECLLDIFPTNKEIKYQSIFIDENYGDLIPIICLLYILYKTLCLKDPNSYYGLNNNSITFTFNDLTVKASKNGIFLDCQRLLQSSSWFLNHGTLSKGNSPIWKPNKNINLQCSSLLRHLLGKTVFCAIDDKTDFGDLSDREKEKHRKRAMALIESIDENMKSRFLIDKEIPILHITIKQDFFKDYVENKKKKEGKILELNNEYIQHS